jgi:hypothetical protein
VAEGPAVQEADLIILGRPGSSHSLQGLPECQQRRSAS